MKKALSVSLMLTLAFAASATAPAEESGSPEDPFPEISTATLKIRLDTTHNFLLIDVRTEEEYIEGHIPRAISVPPEKIGLIADFLPADRDIPIVFYCRGYV